MNYQGDFDEDATVYIDFTTNDGAGGAVAPSSAFESADVKIYKNGSATEKTSTNGLTMTSPFDSVVGYHVLAIDTSDDTSDSGFWVTGADYAVILDPDETVDGQSIASVIGTFSIENRSEVDLSGIANVGSAVHRPASSYTLTTGTQSANTYTATEALDGTNHEHTDDTGAMELYYEFSIGAGLASSVQVSGYINGNNDSIGVYGYDWVASAWVQIGTLEGQNSSINKVNSYDLFVNMVGSGANAGVVRVRFYQASGLTSATLKIDQIFVAFNQTTEGYQNAGVWFDSNASNTNTVKGVDGTATNPVSTMGAVNTLLTSTNLSRVEVLSGSTVTLSVTQNNQVFSGENWTLDINGQDIAGSTFIGANVSGIISGVGTMQKFINCSMGAVTLIKNTHIHGGSVTGTQTVGEAGDYFYDAHHSGIAGSDTWTFDFGGAIGDTNLNLRHNSGGVQFENMGDTGTDTASLEGWGQLIEGTCTGGEVAIRGNFTVSGITNLTLVDGARFESGQLVDDIMDEPLTGLTHNVTNSLGKITRESKEIAVYPFSAIHVDTMNGTAGTTDYENGTALTPVDNIADALILAVSLGFSKFIITIGSSITLASTFDSYFFTGNDWTLALGGQDVSDCTFEGTEVSGVGTGSGMHFRKSNINTVTLPGDTHFHRSTIAGDITAGSAGDFLFDQCVSGVAGGGTPSFDFGAGVANVSLGLRLFSGGMEIKNYNVSGIDTMSFDGFGQLIVNANCAGGTVFLRGNQTITDNASGAVTFSDDARFDIIQSVKNITGRLPSALVGGRMDSNISAINNDNTSAVLMALAQRGLVTGVAQMGTLSVTQMTTNLIEATDDHYNGRIIVWTSGVLDGQATNITDYDGTTKTLTYTTTTEAPANGDTFVMY